MPFLRNVWYVAAWEDEVPADEMFSRKILGEDILFVRDEAGGISAMRDRCPHRFAPLRLGTRTTEGVTCAYHGLSFGFDGRCIHNPQGDGKLPEARVQTYPVEVRAMLVWIWMGDPALADPAAIPEIVGHDPERYAINKGYLFTPANYELVTDNIMDLGHIEFIHAGFLGSEAVRRASVEIIQDGDTVHSNRLTSAEILPDALDDLFAAEGQPIDRWLDVRWDAPGVMQLIIGVAPAGSSPQRVGRETPGVHIMTPETDTTTHYFWSNARDFRVNDTVLHEQLAAGLQYAFEHQDKPMIIAQAEAMGSEDFWDLKPIILEGDAGAIRARRILRKRIRGEQAALAGVPA